MLYDCQTYDSNVSVLFSESKIQSMTGETWFSHTHTDDSYELVL